MKALLLTAFLAISFSANADPAVNRAFEEYRQKIEELDTQLNGTEFEQAAKRVPLLSSEEMQRLNEQQLLMLQDKRLAYRNEKIQGSTNTRPSVNGNQVTNQKPQFEADDDNTAYVKDENGNYKKVSLDEVFGDEPAAAPTAGTQDIKANLSKFYQEKGIDDNFVSKMIDKQMKEKLAEMMKQNPLSNLSKDDLAQKIEDNSRNTALGRMMKKNPKIKEAMVEFAHDKDALPGLVSIINKPKKMKYYGIAVIIIMISAFTMNLMNTKGNLLKRIFNKMCLAGATFSLNIGAFYFFFSEELAPTVTVMKRVFGL